MKVKLVIYISNQGQALTSKILSKTDIDNLRWVCLGYTCTAYRLCLWYVCTCKHKWHWQVHYLISMYKLVNFSVHHRSISPIRDLTCIYMHLAADILSASSLSESVLILMVSSAAGSVFTGYTPLWNKWIFSVPTLKKSSNWHREG